MFYNSIVTVQGRNVDVRVDVPDNVGPLGAFRSRGPAERLLASYDDVAANDDIVDGRVETLVDVDGRGTFYVPVFEYNRVVRR